ncbi:MAG: S8 family serine peptidase [Phycisphaerales bacterium]|nr:S8 family serine peptidase [Phycisphaerales bacterium]
MSISVVAFTCLIQAAAMPGPSVSTPTTEQARAAHWVYFTDKGLPSDQLPGALDRLADSYDAHARNRRALRRTDPGLFDARDLPVSPTYIEQLKRSGAMLRTTSRWLNAASITASPAQLAEIARLPGVAKVQPVRAGRRITPPAERPTDAGPARDFYGYASDQLAQINLQALHAQGHTGQGVIIGILDTGFRTSHVVFNEPGHSLDIVAAHDFINDDEIVGEQPGDPDGQHSHGTLILGCIGAYRPGELVGGAYNARFVLCKTEDISGETPVEEDYYVAGLEFAEMHGADVATSSLGYIDWYSQGDLDGQTAVTTLAVNIATANGVHCCTAAGNAGHDDDPGASHLIAPADAPRVITCGAAWYEGTIADFSSDGPTADGRLKPEVLARGVETATIWPYDDTSYATASGTSLSTPLVAAAVACLAGARPDWTPDQLRDYLFRSASDFAATGQTDPLFIRGYGILNAAAALALGCRPDLNHDGVVDFADYLAFLNLYDALDLAVDFNGDGIVDFGDYLEFLNLYDAGC